jgi:hypothetical protein
MVLVHERNCTRLCLKSYRPCLNLFGTKHTHYHISGLKGEALFLELRLCPHAVPPYIPHLCSKIPRYIKVRTKCYGTLGFTNIPSYDKKRKWKNCPITITLLLCKLMDTHQTWSPPITSPKQKMFIQRHH